MDTKLLGVTYLEKGDIADTKLLGVSYLERVT